MMGVSAMEVGFIASSPVCVATCHVTEIRSQDQSHARWGLSGGEDASAPTESPGGAGVGFQPLGGRESESGIAEFRGVARGKVSGTFSPAG